MKNVTQLFLAFMLFALTLSTTKANAQLNETHQRSQIFQSVPQYASGGFTTLVWNSTTNRMEFSTTPVCNDTVNGVFTVYANGASSKAWQVVTPYVFAPLMVASRTGKNADLNLTDSSGSKYLELNSNDGLTAYDTLWCNTKWFRVETITGTKSITADSTKLRVDCNKIVMGTGSIQITSGSGTPLNVVSAPVGSLYIRTNGVADSTLYVKSVGVDSAGWYPLTTH